MSLTDSRDKKKVSIKIAGITELQQTILGSGRYFILTKNMFTYQAPRDIIYTKSMEVL